MLRRLARHLILLAAALAWLLGVSAGHLHHLEVFHSVCLDHAETIELSQAAEGHEDHERPVATPSAPHDDHGHGCLMALAGLSAVPASTHTAAPPPPAQATAASQAPASRSPAAPSLLDAPKQSPPWA